VSEEGWFLELLQAKDWLLVEEENDHERGGLHSGEKAEN